MAKVNLDQYIIDHVKSIEIGIPTPEFSTAEGFKVDDTVSPKPIALVHLVIPVKFPDDFRFNSTGDLERKAVELAAMALEGESNHTYLLEELIIEMDGWIGTTAVEDWDRLSNWKKVARKLINPSRFRA